jgi:hypothetical protein
MNTAHLHLIVNHLPVLGTLFVALLLGWGLWRRSRDVVRLALGGAVIVALISYPVYLTGGAAEEAVEDQSWVREQLIDGHEERAQAALFAAITTGMIAVFALWRSRGGKPVTPGLSAPLAAALVISTALFGWTALSGGSIRHEEIRAGVVAASGGEAGEGGAEARVVAGQDER